MPKRARRSRELEQGGVWPLLKRSFAIPITQCFRADCAGQEAALAHAVPAWPAQRLPGTDEARRHATLRSSKLTIVNPALG